MADSNTILIRAVWP